MNPAFATRTLIAISFMAFQAAALASEHLNLDAEGVLMHGFDPVSYFDGEPGPGNSSLSVEHNGARVHFASIENLERFKAAPNHYMPMYGGYCSYGVRMGQKFDIDPLAYEIEGNRLYLLLDRATRAIWDQDRDHNIGIADRIWESIRTVPASALVAE